MGLIQKGKVIFLLVAMAVLGRVDAYIQCRNGVSLIDEVVDLRFDGLFPGERVKVEASAKGGRDLWSSWGLFEADGSGNIDLATQAPIDGTYQGIDPMGLFWSMSTRSEKATTFKMEGDRFFVDVTIFRKGRKLETKRLIRLRKRENVKRIGVKEEELLAVLFLPPTEKPLPVVVILSGSNGGYGENRAQLLASHGFATLALGYFGMEGLPPRLEEISLEYFQKAFAWLKRHPAIDGDRIGLYGISRGGELSLLLSSLFPDTISSVAAVVPSSVVHGTLGGSPVKDTWIYQGKAVLPFAPVAEMIPKRGEGKDRSHLATTLPFFLEGMEDLERFDQAAIEVEKMTSSLFLISGGEDQMWPSEYFCHKIQERIKNSGSGIRCEYFHYPQAGHGINIPNIPQPDSVYYHPVAKLWFSMGGTRPANQKASLDSWNRLVDFFKQTLEDGEENEKSICVESQPLVYPLDPRHWDRAHSRGEGGAATHGSLRRQRGE